MFSSSALTQTLDRVECRRQQRTEHLEPWQGDMTVSAIATSVTAEYSAMCRQCNWSLAMQTETLLQCTQPAHHIQTCMLYCGEFGRPEELPFHSCFFDAYTLNCPCLYLWLETRYLCLYWLPRLPRQSTVY